MSVIGRFFLGVILSFLFFWILYDGYLPSKRPPLCYYLATSVGGDSDFFFCGLAEQALEQAFLSRRRIGLKVASLLVFWKTFIDLLLFHCITKSYFNHVIFLVFRFAVNVGYVSCRYYWR